MHLNLAFIMFTNTEVQNHPEELLDCLVVSMKDAIRYLGNGTIFLII
jgi:hypothetical protein